MPLDALELKKEVENVNWMNEIDEGIAYIALSFQVHGKVEVVILSFVIDIDHVEQLHLLELVRNVPNHNCCSLLFSSHDPVEVDIVAQSLLTFLLLF